MIAWLIGTRIGRAVSGALALILAFAGAWVAGRREGAQNARNKAVKDDYEHAEDIRNRVERDLAGKLRKHDDSGWRD